MIEDIKGGSLVRVKVGATEWMKRAGHWADYITRDIDGMIGRVTGDYRNLGGYDSHLCVDLGFEHGVGV